MQIANYKKIFLTLGLLSGLCSYAQRPVFRAIPLGVKGGIDESNLSAYLVAPAGSDNFICLDAGTLHYGLQIAVNNHVFAGPPEQVLKNNIKAYFISHAHLDHVSGLIINSPDDGNKTIYSNTECLKTLSTKYFTWDSWANFTTDGDKPRLNKYTLQPITSGETVNVAGTEMQVQAFPLSHSNLESTAFLVNSSGNYLLYLGDTGADEVEKSHNLDKLWQAVAPLIKAQKLKAIFIEVSFPNEQPSTSLFGHLTPDWLMTEMEKLSTLSGATALKNVSVVITHVKPPEANISKIKQQLRAENKLQLKLVFPEQGHPLLF
ncbi:3',5'-cyclic-nucleotide phosphodiesterase [Mucilaginibacter robiniae]|uniref:3',5'-cyclic-nucleotide phosphodiesterase n=1 Tax=Mucilaginibacter robiniae TaxID=2728022 RepID=A0A7L5E6M0_9SPHI|nr:3',5'-cyclic-nucleotide phosphodiesterase [Mucilaginibacter robiniae]QJD97404.1 3',5'-cyclic-nucleotide phosphodiesterase [Mucilaginibacter robiniae]